MIARNVTMHLKPNSVAEFTQTCQKEIIPLLRQQKGFQDEITFIVPGECDAVGVSFWDKQENADAYSRGTYPEVVKALDKVLDGTPLRFKTGRYRTLPSTASAYWTFSLKPRGLFGSG